MYDRKFDDHVLSFEASGGLLNSSLVLQDKETDSYWSIMKGLSIAGQLAKTPLRELPVGTKCRWREWVEMYPNTKVLSVNGREDLATDPYRGYLESDQGFGSVAVDQRLAAKEPIFGFVFGGASFAVPLRSVEGGAVLEIDLKYIFLYRPIGSHVIRSTVAYISSSGGFVQAEGDWIHSHSGSTFNPVLGVFDGEAGPELRRMEGFDTFWYTWSPLHPGARIIRP